MSKRIALVLGSGGARGYAHIGVIEEIERRGYEIGCIAGCSIGAVIGGIHAAGKLSEYSRWIQSLDQFAILRLLDVSFRLGAIRGEKVFGKIRELLGEIQIEELAIPYTAVATDLTHQQEIWFQEGCLHQAMRASAAIPSLFTPVLQGSRMLVDGGLLNPLPIIPVVSSHCDLIIAVDLNSEGHKNHQLSHTPRPAPMKQRIDNVIGHLGAKLSFARKEGSVVTSPLHDALNEPAMTPRKPLKGPASLLDLINQSFEVMQSSLSQYKIAGYPPDILVNIPKRSCRFFEFYRAQELIELGRKVASDSIDHYERN